MRVLGTLRPGVFVPVVTPFLRNGKIDFKRLELHANDLLAAGVDGIVVAGTTGEGHALAVQEKKELIAFATGLRRKRGKHFTIIAGTGTQEIVEAIEIARYAKEKGCEAILALPPRTNRQRQIEKFYTTLSHKSSIPILAYHIPSVSGAHIHPETLARLVRKTSVIGGKYSAQDPAILKEWRRKSPNAFIVVGEDKLIQFGVREAGAQAAIPGTGNIAPRQLVKVFRQARKGKGALAQAHVNRIVDELLATGNFGGAVKAILKARGTIRTDARRTPGALTSAKKRKLFSRKYRPR